MADRDPLLGAAVGHYTIDQLIGEGGMGRVYLAHHANLPNKRYAFKVLLGDHAASSMMRARFTREAERASQLDHPNVVKVVDFGQTTHGLLYIVMDYVEGASLVSLIDEGPMPPAQVISLAREICKGLVYAHAAGIVHRDLKPENILVSSGSDGMVPRIVDFGLAMSLDQSDARLTESGMTMGTPAFAAPEQLSGKLVDHRADLFALGMTMFEMLSGGLLPFEGHVMEMVSAKTTRDAPRLSERAPDLAIPPELDDLVARLTRRNPAERYASARAVIEALDAVHLGPEARRATEVTEYQFTGPHATPRARWRKTVIGLFAACGLGVTAWYAMAARQRVPTAVPMPSPRVAAVPAESARARPVAMEPAPVALAVIAPVAQATAPSVAASDPGSEVAASSERAPAAAPAKQHHHRQRIARPAVHVEPVAAPPAPVPAMPVVALPAPVSPSLPDPPAPLRQLRAKLAGVEVDGSLPRAGVTRAIDREWPAIARCTPSAPGTVVAHFTIGETRRARDVRATGSTAETSACVVAAFADVRTEAAPDVGDVEVTVRIAFVEKT
ncbi:MAG TPA: protein kinase [Kofleriaceae bacterium]|jgi:serine/threonine-protein kinase|nr:protein kinase [Kofleriaceae bacterium]